MTTYSQIGCLIVRGVSLLLLVNTLPYILIAGASPWSGLPLSHQLSMFATPILNLLLSRWMWIKAPILGIRIADKPTPDSIAIPINYEHLQIVLLVTAGFLIVAKSFRPLLNAIPNFINYMQEESSKLDWRSLSEGVLYLALGLLMIFTARGITRLVGAARKL